MGEAVVYVLLNTTFQDLFERPEAWKNVTKSWVGKFKRNHGNNGKLFKNLEHALVRVEKLLTSQINRELVERLTDAVNQTADLLDEIYSKDLAKSQSSGKSDLHKIIQKSKRELENMTKILEEIAKLKDDRGLKESSSIQKSSRVESTSSVDESKVFGRDEDRRTILNFLMGEPGQTNGNDIPLIAIIGMAGIGKTTLAQLLFNDSDVKCHFGLRVWVHVSEDMDVVKVTKTLYEKVTGRTSDIQDPDTLQVKLIEELKESSFLFVFDDVWTEDRLIWYDLQKALKSGVPQSRIIVTTRNQEVASAMRASQTHHLRPLSDADCWFLFSKQAFGSDVPLELKPIAQDMVKKCGGLPLVARELGSLLYSKADAKEWENILNCNLFDLSTNKIDILAWFKSSFNHLSSPFLKQCFAYCSIIPKGYAFDREKLILLWMAQGFLLQRKSGGTMEHLQLESGSTMERVGITYFQELLANSFFQQASGDDKSLFVMHDLINELAQFVSPIQSCLVEKGKSPNISDKTRHVVYVCDGHDKEADLIDVLRKAKFLWTFIPLSLFNNSRGSSSIGMGVVNELWKQKQLRVLSFSYQENKLPKEFGKLLHLRYLDLSDSAIVELPEKISNLYTLQTLILSRCIKLIELPKKMADLINLGHLDLTGTSALQMMPPAFGKLKSLRIVTNFVVSNSPKASSIKELGKLLLLRGKLSILELQNVRAGEDAENANLKEKKNVKELEFKWSCDGRHDQKEVLEKLHPHEDIDHLSVAGQEEVLEKLRPHEDIEKLSIAGYGGTRLPNWLGDSSFSKMVILRLSDCRNCSYLPSLGQLSSLQQLHITNMPNCDQWLSLPVTGGGYLSLQELYVENCEELTAIPNNLISLKLLSINTCRQLKFDDFMGYEKLQNLRIRSCDCLEKLTLNFYRELESLQIHDCKGLSFLKISDCSLQTLDISDCPKLVSFLHGGLPPSLTLTINNCDKLTPAEWPKLSTEVALPKIPATVEKQFKLLDRPSTSSLPEVEELQLPDSNVEQKTDVSTEISFNADADDLIDLKEEKECEMLSPPEWPKLSTEVALPKVPTTVEKQFHENKMLLDRPSTSRLPEVEELQLSDSNVVQKTDVSITSNSPPWESLKRLAEDSSAKQGGTSNDSSTATEISSNADTDDPIDFWYAEDSLEDISSPELESLNVSEILQLKKLPLKLYSLKIEGCDALKSLPEELKRNTHLRHLSIIDCHFFKSIHLNHLPISLKTLYIRKCKKLEFLSPLDKHTSLEHLCIESSCDSPKSFPLGCFPKLRNLSIQDCANFNSISVGSEDHMSLDGLDIRDCAQLISFNEEGLRVPNLTSLLLSNCKDLKALPGNLHNLTSLQSLVINECPALESIPKWGLPLSLNLVRISSCHQLTPRIEWGLHRLKNFSRIEIEDGCRDLESFPEENLLPRNLNSLRISRFPNLKFLDYKGLQRLASLETLKINSCNNLQSFPEEGLPSSLSYLCISDCPLLKSKLQNRRGKEWYKIAHISHIEIDMEVISSK